jgi:GNAT superfamily N-acetyltransferase
VATPQCRPAVPADAAECIQLRSKTRENAISVAHLASLGISVASWTKRIAAASVIGHVCTDGGRIVGYCFGDGHTGEILVLALLPDYEGRGIGRLLLSLVVKDLWKIGFRRLFLGCSKNPGHRSHGFYRHLGWRPTGALNAQADEVLELHRQDSVGES